MSTAMYDFGMVGLGTMGRNLLLNIADNGFAAIGFDRDPSKGELLEASATAGTKVKGVNSLADLVAGLKPPRRIMMLVPAGPIVDSVINDLLPLVETGDIIIDGGNSHFNDTLRRIAFLSDKKVHFIGMGVSGGEDGARRGPSIMPGGDVEAWTALQPILEAISAKVNNEPCVAYMGKNAAGHYVKMVHNGIEYAIMQLISETYDLLKRGGNFSNEQLAETFAEWNAGFLKSFLIEITAQIFREKDAETGNALVDMILDKAGSKGTGKWTSQEAMDLGQPVPVIDIAVSSRDLSAHKSERVQAAAIYKPVVKPLSIAAEKLKTLAGEALYASIILCYSQGLSMLQTASVERKMDIPLRDVVRIWRGGCIIRSTLLETLSDVFKKSPAISNFLLDKKITPLIKKNVRSLRIIAALAIKNRVPAAGMMSALGYFDAYVTDRLPTNLVQAQRDFFGAHTYQRIDREGSFHTEWTNI